MPRQLRIEYAGAIYHVTVRGNARQCIFLDQRDRELLCERLARAVETYSVRLYLFCLMENHLHLVLETPKANLGRFMHSVLTSYTVCYNLRHDLHGHLTQGRYGAKLVEGNEYLLKLSRYVHLNPVKVALRKGDSLADKIAALKGYEWSSYRSYIGLAQRLKWVDYDPMLALVGGKGRGKLALYRRFVETGIAENDAEFIEAQTALVVERCCCQITGYSCRAYTSGLCWNAGNSSRIGGDVSD
ncbi:MAG: transposase [Lentisphaerae bacterium]|nr:transposase [Lentisphaerota bacterium]